MLPHPSHTLGVEDGPLDTQKTKNVIKISCYDRFYSSFFFLPTISLWWWRWCEFNQSRLDGAPKDLPYNDLGGGFGGGMQGSQKRTFSYSHQFVHRLVAVIKKGVDNVPLLLLPVTYGLRRSPYVMRFSSFCPGVSLFTSPTPPLLPRVQISGVPHFLPEGWLSWARFFPLCPRQGQKSVAAVFSFVQARLKRASGLEFLWPLSYLFPQLLLLQGNPWMEGEEKCFAVLIMLHLLLCLV